MYHPTMIEVPGRGLVNLDAARVDAAVREYDERLRFGYNPTNDDWCVYIQYPRDFEGAPYLIDGTPVMPVLGFGKEIPSVGYAMNRLNETDQWKHGKRTMEKMEREHEALKKARQVEQDELTQEAAERVEHAMRYYGESPVTRIYLSGNKKKPGYNIGRRDS